MAFGAEARATFLAIVKGDASQAVTEFKNLGGVVSKSTGQAGQSVSKFKSLMGQATGEIKANAGALAAGAAAGFAAFALKAADAFTQTSKAAIDLGQATALSTEEASRWIAIADDYQLSVEDLETGLGQIAKRLDTAPWDKYGIATRDAGGNARSVNDILIDTLDMLSRTTNETERNRIASELMGRGWANIAPILGHTRSEYEDMLSSVEDGQVITAEEAAKAEKWRLAQDTLSDAFHEFTLAVGQAAVSLAPLVERIAQVVTYANKLGVLESAIPPSSIDDVGSLSEMMRSLAAGALESGDAIGYFTDRGYSAELATRVLHDYQNEVWGTQQATRSNLDIHLEWQASMNRITGALGDEEVALSDAARAAGEYARKVNDAKNAYNDLLDALNSQKTLADLELQLIANADRMDDLRQQYEDGEISAEEYYLGVASLAADSKLAVAEYADELGNVPDSITTQVVTTFDPANPQAVFNTLQQWFNQRKLYVTVEGQIADAALRNALEGRGNYSATSAGAGGDTTVQIVVNDKVVQEVTNRAQALNQGMR